MEERAEGIILRTRPLTETSLIVDWITAEAGRISTVAKGARRPKSTFAGKLDFAFRANISFQRSARSELHALREVQLLDQHTHLRTDYARLHQAAYFAVLIEKGTERETPLPEVYSLLAEYLANPPVQDCLPEAMFQFEYRFLEILGVAPQVDHPLFASVRPVTPLNRDERNELNRILKHAIGTTLERLPPQRQSAIEAILNQK